MKPKIRMVGLDLDGTVFNNNKEISTHTRSVLKEAIRQGCIVLPATGRPEIGLPGAFFGDSRCGIRTDFQRSPHYP